MTSCEKKKKIMFQCDYTEGCHERVLERLVATNMEQSEGYGEDAYCAAARASVRRFVEREDVAVHFLVGGTQTNATVIAAALRPHQGVLCAATGHINVHETGAIEATGHKVLALPSADGKLTAAQVRAALAAHRSDACREHTVQPGLVYASHPTETGTLYTRAELAALSAACRAGGVPLYVDGARLAYGLGAPGSDVRAADLARLCDAFYIGGTKCGALFGEAVVVAAPALQRDFRYLVKQHGALLAKGRLLGVQFDALLRDGLYTALGAHAVRLAQRVRAAFAARGCTFLHDSPTNQIFPVLADAHLAALAEHYVFDPWCRTDATHSAVRVCTSWATTDAQVDALCRDIASLPSL